MDGSAVVIPKKMLALKSLNVVDATSVDFRDRADTGERQRLPACMTWRVVKINFQRVLLEDRQTVRVTTRESTKF